MPVVCDFQIIQGDAQKRIGDGAMIWEKNFSTGGRYKGGHAILMLMVKGLTATKSDVAVKINNKKIGVIEHYNGADSRHWFTQIINIGSGYLNNGSNELQIEAVTFDKATSKNLFDDFYIKDVICFFQQEA